VGFDPKGMKALGAIRAREWKSPLRFSCLDVFAGPRHIVPSVPHALVEDRPSAVPAAERTQSEEAQVEKDFGNGLEDFHEGPILS